MDKSSGRVTQFKVGAPNTPTTRQSMAAAVSELILNGTAESILIEGLKDLPPTKGDDHAPD